MKYSKEIKKIEEDILSDKIPSGQFLKDAVLRQRKDLEDGYLRGIYFDHEIGQEVIDFAELLIDFKGDPMEVFWWNKLEYYYFFGWRRTDTGGRRFRIMYCSMARKNQKTISRVPKIFYHLIYEENFNPEVYIAANKEDQAKICFGDVKVHLERNEVLKEYFSSSSERVYSLEDQSKIGFLTSNPKTADGTRPTYGLIDEYHEFETDEMPNVIETGMINRQEKILEYITTRGSDKSKPCYINEQRLFIPVLKGVVQNDSIFVLIFCPDEDDDIFDKKTWYKANPNLGNTISEKTFEEALEKAVLQGAEKMADFKTKNLNIWVDAPTTVIKDEDWMKGYDKKLKLEDFAGRDCVAGFDMAMSDDFAAYVELYPDRPITDFKSKLEYETNIKFYAFWWFWITEDSIKKRVSNGLHSINDWVNDGWVEVCEGNFNSHVQIQNKILERNHVVNIERFAFDPALIGSIAESLQNDGIHVEIVYQKIYQQGKPTGAFDSTGKPIYENTGLSPVLEWLKKLVYEGRIIHNGNPVMRWMIQNIVQTTDTMGNIWFTKDYKKKRDKIDGVSALINGLASSKAMFNARSVYDDRGFVSL